MVLTTDTTTPLVPSPSGTGKTLAFLLPIIQQLKDDEMTHRIATRLKRPRALVLAPSRELAQQILVRHWQTCTARTRLAGLSSPRRRCALTSDRVWC